jgi:hypothetical protein
MGLQMRDDRQMKALTGLSQAQFDHLLPVFRDIYRATQQQLYEPMVLVSYTPYHHIGLLQTKFRYREGHETRRIGP